MSRVHKEENKMIKGTSENDFKTFEHSYTS